MGQIVTLRIVHPVTGEAVEVEGAFSAEEWQFLQRFVEYADQLRGTRIGREGAEVVFRIRWTEESGLEYQVGQLPSDDDLAAFLHRLRPFVLQTEPTSFGRVCNLLSRRFEHPVAREALDRPRALFSGSDFQSLLKISVNDLVVNSEQALHAWLNGYEYHRDRDKQVALETIAPAMPLEAARAIFVSMMLDKAKAVRHLARLVRILTEDETGDPGISL